MFCIKMTKEYYMTQNKFKEFNGKNWINRRERILPAAIL